MGWLNLWIWNCRSTEPNINYTLIFECTEGGHPTPDVVQGSTVCSFFEFMNQLVSEGLHWYKLFSPRPPARQPRTYGRTIAYNVQPPQGPPGHRGKKGTWPGGSEMDQWAQEDRHQETITYTRMKNERYAHISYHSNSHSTNVSWEPRIYQILSHARHI